MKTSQQKTGVAEKKPQNTAASVLSTAPSASPVEVGKPSTFESPSAAVWSRYISSRLKQFETR